MSCEIILGSNYVVIGTRTVCGRCHIALIEVNLQNYYYYEIIIKDFDYFSINRIITIIIIILIL
jgi:hypothetical protein